MLCESHLKGHRKMGESGGRMVTKGMEKKAGKTANKVEEQASKRLWDTM